MPEVPNAYRCDYCHVLMEPIEFKDHRWHTKYCSACHMKLYDVFIGNDASWETMPSREELDAIHAEANEKWNALPDLIKRIQDDPALSCNLLPHEKRAWQAFHAREEAKPKSPKGL